MMRKTFDAKGVKYAKELAIKNILDLQKILKWNSENEIFVYRMSSDMFPWLSEWNPIDDEEIVNHLRYTGKLIQIFKQRVSFHPGPFNVLGSLNPRVVANTIDELNKHAAIMDAMKLSKNRNYLINIHINHTKPNKDEAIKRWIDGYNNLSDSAKRRLTIENDDKPACFTVKDLMPISKELNIPIVFDNLHWECNPGDQTFMEAFNDAKSTWKDITQLVHWSSSKLLFEDKQVKKLAHADYIYEQIPEIFQCDIEIEAKAKDLALLKYRKEFLNNGQNALC